MDDLFQKHAKAAFGQFEIIETLEKILIRPVVVAAHVLGNSLFEGRIAVIVVGDFARAEMCA